MSSEPFSFTLSFLRLIFSFLFLVSGKTLEILIVVTSRGRRAEGEELTFFFSLAIFERAREIW